MDPTEVARILPEQFTLSDAEIVKLILRGESVIDWHRLDFTTEEEAKALLSVHEFDPSDPEDRKRLEKIQQDAISYLRRHFRYPVPERIERATVEELMLLASGEDELQAPACTVLKAMHIVHHVASRELLLSIPMSLQGLFNLVEEKVYHVIGDLLSNGFPITEFIGGRKNKDSLYTKLLSKPQTIGAPVYDRLRFRIVTRSKQDVLPVIRHMYRSIFPFNYVLPGQSLNTLFHLRSHFAEMESVKPHLESFQIPLTDDYTHNGNVFSASTFRAIHFVVDVPVRLSPEILAQAPPSAKFLGSVVPVVTEFQIVDRETQILNEMGDGSHSAYKMRQKLAVMRRLRMDASLIELLEKQGEESKDQG